MDHCELTSAAFDALADNYQAKFMTLSLYDESYRVFCEQLRPRRARVLDAACGPGNVARSLLAQRPELDLLGIDLAPRMVELAQAAVPSARFRVQDCRDLRALQRRFDGIICAFGLPYLNSQEVHAFIAAAADILEPAGVLYLSTMLADDKVADIQRCRTGDQVYIYYHSEDLICSALTESGLTLVWRDLLASPAGSATVTTDLIVVACKQSCEPSVPS